MEGAADDAQAEAADAPVEFGLERIGAGLARNDAISIILRASLPRSVPGLLDTIFLHVGLPKTGTSCLQESLCALSQAGLLTRVGYPCVDPASGAGNGTALARELIFTNRAPTSTGRMQDLIHELVAANDGRAPDLLISSEDLCYADVEKFSRLRQALLGQARSIRMLVAVRPLREWSYSVYLQLVKAHALAADYDADWLQAHTADFLHYFRNLDRFGVDATVFRYRSTGLLRHFLGILGEDEALASRLPETVANRSLGLAEVGVLRAINAVFADESLCRAVSEAFAREWPGRRGATMPPGRLKDFEDFAVDFARRLDQLPGPVMDAARAILFAAADTPLPPAPDDAAAPGLLAGPEVGVALRAIQDHVRARTEEAALHRGLLDYSAGLERTSETFDPIHYLLMHPDVLRSGSDPGQHFERHGRAEGRPSSFRPRGAGIIDAPPA